MRLAFTFCLAQFALSQMLTPTDQVAVARDALIPRALERQLRCTAEPVGPILLYTAPELGAGFRYSMPMSQYSSGRPTHGWSVTAGFTAQDGSGRQSYLTGHIDPASPTQETVSESAAYWVGPGTYSVQLAVADDRGGVCRMEWTIGVNRWPLSVGGTFGSGFAIPEGADGFDLRTQMFLSSKTAFGTPAGVVRPPVRKGSASSTPGDTTGGVTILLDAPSDPPGQLAAMDALEALLARFPARPARLVVFSLAEGREIFRQDGFPPGSLAKVREACALLGYRAVTVNELQAHGLLTPAKLIDSLVQRETHEEQQGSAVIFLGTEFGSGMMPRFSPVPARPLPPFFYVHLLRPALMQLRTPTDGAGTNIRSLSPQVSNLVSWAVDKLHGKSLNITSDKQFDQADQKIEQAIQSGRH